MEKYRNKDWLYNEYITNDKTIVQIAEELGVVHSTIAVWTRKHGIKKPKKPSNNNTKVEIKCSGCGSAYDANLRQLVRKIRDGQTNFHCSRECFAESLSTKYLGEGNPMSGRFGEDNPTWKGGVIGVNEFTRSLLRNWKFDILKASNFTCFITGQLSHSLEVHHITPFHEIRDAALLELNLDIRKTVSEYSREELDALSEKIIKAHEKEKGFAIEKSIHKLFHSIYGFKTNEQNLVEFKTRYLSGEFSESRAI